MRYYILDVLGDYEKGGYCFVDGLPSGIDGDRTPLKYGGDLSEIYPEDPYEVTLPLDEDLPKNIKKGDYVSTSDQYMIVSSQVVEALKEFNIGEVDFWPFTLLNHKGRVHSQDYRFVVPRAQYDAVNIEKSDLRYDNNGICIGIRSLVLDKEKLKTAPDMFKVNDTRRMAFSERLVKKLQANFTNFVFDEADVA